MANRNSAPDAAERLLANTEEALDQLAGIVAAQNRVIEALGAHTEMLGLLLEAARIEPEASPISDHITALTAAITKNTEILESLARDVQDMPVQIAAAFEGSGSEAPPPRPII